MESSSKYFVDNYMLLPGYVLYKYSYNKVNVKIRMSTKKLPLLKTYEKGKLYKHIKHEASGEKRARCLLG